MTHSSFSLTALNGLTESAKFESAGKGREG